MEHDYIFLLIEDNIIDQLITSQLLKTKLGVTELTIANNGREGIEWLHKNKLNLNKPLIILLDIRMPEMDGFEFLSAYESLASEIKTETQIFMLSSTLDYSDISKAKDNNYVRKLLGKPLAVNELEELLVE